MAHCHAIPESGALIGEQSIALVGHPNVGKSVLFQRLTGQRVTVSNYPGTTVEVARGAARALPGRVVVDTPGVVAFPPLSEDEEVTARVLLNESPSAILQVGDAKNLRRTLLLSVQLAEMGIPLVIALNMMDEVRARGIVFDAECIAETLNAPVIPTTATRGQGIEALTAALKSAQPSTLRLAYPPAVEAATDQFCALFQKNGAGPAPISVRALALLWLSEDHVTGDWLQKRVDAETWADLLVLRDKLADAAGEPAAGLIQRVRLEFVGKLTAGVLTQIGSHGRSLAGQLGRWATHPVWGLVMLGAVLYGLYWFVGILGAGVLVGLLEERLFGQLINPLVVSTVEQVVRIPLLVELLVGEYGLWTMGMTYALALILPIVFTFFLAFGVLEDSGYLPRLAALSNRMFKSLGLNGKAVLPMVLGLGCVTMATVTTRVLETRRERLLVTLLLALAVPCSAQLGVVMGMLAGISLAATTIWGGVVLLTLLAVGWLAARLVPGERSELMVELPPMRWPQASNVALKTLARLEWYIKEVVPLFLLGAFLMFIFDRLGLLVWIMAASEPLVSGWLGLPPEASTAFVMGFLRRDFGATGLFVMQNQGLLNPMQVVVAMVTVTLFVPCIASVLMIARERGWKNALAILTVVFPLAFVVGGLLYRLLALVGWGL